MPHKARIRQESIISMLRYHLGDVIAFTVIIMGILYIKSWNPEPSAEDINKRRALINKQLTVELNECIEGDIDVIVGLHNCRPFRNHKEAKIWRVK